MKLGNLGSEEIASRLILTAVNYEENKKELEDFPFVKKGSIALMTLLCVGDKNENGQYTVCLAVTNKLKDSWGIEKSQLFDFAVANSKKMFPTMFQEIGNYLEAEKFESLVSLSDEINITDMMVLSNHIHFNGAASMFYDPEVLDDIAASMKAEKVILLPSSNNQLYCAPYRSQRDLQEYQDIFMKHALEMEENHALTNSVLLYDSKNKNITELNGVSYDLSMSETVNRRMEHKR